MAEGLVSPAVAAAMIGTVAAGAFAAGTASGAEPTSVGPKQSSQALKSVQSG